MKRAIVSIATSVTTCLAWAVAAFGAQVVGIVKSADGAVVQGVRISKRGRYYRQRHWEMGTYRSRRSLPNRQPSKRKIRL